MNLLSQSMKDHFNDNSPVFEGKTCYDYMAKKMNNEFPTSYSSLGWHEDWRRSLSNQS